MMPLPFRFLGQDHKELQQDIEDFPYRIYHGNVNVPLLCLVILLDSLRLEACES